MAIPYSKIGPDQLDLEALSQRLIAENGIVTKASGIPSNIADSVEEIGGVSSSNIAKAHISEDDESYKWQSGFTDEENNKELFKDRNTVLNSVNLGGRPADDYMTKDDGGSLGTVQQSMITAYNSEIADLKDELYQLRSELERNNYVQDYGMYSGISDHFNRNKYRNCQTCLAYFEYPDYNDMDILILPSEIYEMFDLYDYICLVNRDNLYCIRQIIEKTDKELKIRLNANTSFTYGGLILDDTIQEEKELLAKATADTLFVFKSRGIIHNGLYKFATKPVNQPSSTIKYYSGLTDDRKRKTVSLLRNGEGIAYSFRIAGSATEKDNIENYIGEDTNISHQGYLDSFSIVVRPYNNPGELECYIFDKNDLSRFKNPIQFENDYRAKVLVDDKPIRFFGHSTWKYKEGQENLKQYAKFEFEKNGQFPLMSRDEDYNDEKVEYVAVICAKNMPAGASYNLLCLQNKNTTASEDSEERDLEVNNQMYSYVEQADDSVSDALREETNSCDLFFQIVTRKAEENLPQPLSSGLYTLHYHNQNLKCHQSAKNSFQSAKLILRTKREGKFVADVANGPAVFSPNNQLSVKAEESEVQTVGYLSLTDTSAYKDYQEVVEENSLYSTQNIPVVIGNNVTTVRSITTTGNQTGESIEPIGFVLADNEDKIYRMGCVAAIKARNIDFNRATGELNISPYERKVLKLAAVCKDYDSDNREYSDRLIFEAGFDSDKDYNDFEVQIYWQNPLLNISPTRDLTYEPRAELMGALKDVVLSVNKKFVEK